MNEGRGDGFGLIVLHVADYAAPYPGAFIAQLKMLDEEMQRRGSGRCAFAFPAPAESTPWFGELNERGSFVATLRHAPGRTRLASAPQLARLVRSTGAAVVHSHFASYDIAAVAAVEWARRRGNPCRLVWHYRTAFERDGQDRPSTRQAKDLLKFRLVGSRIDACLAVTKALALEASLRGLGSKASALLAGCDIEGFTPDAETRARVRATLGLGPDDILVLHLGWAWRRKGGDLLTVAARMLHERGFGSLVFASVGAPGLSGGPVRILPFTDRLHEMHQAADIFVSASRSEGFGNGLVEALASGSVAVASLVDGQREIVEGLDGCVGVPADDPAAIAAGIEHLLTVKAQWPQLGAANRRHVEDNYDMRSWARRMTDFYENLTGAAVPKASL